MSTTRRDFLVQGLGGATLLASGVSLPGFLSRTAWAASLSSGFAARDQSVLVVVQLSGGNDGLNTVIPYEDDAYHRSRPTLRAAAERVLKLDNRLGLHPELAGLKRLYDDGRLSVVTNVGYPNPDRSHFRSMDIWHTARLDPAGVDVGWLGRVVDQMQEQRSAPTALHIGEQSLPLALKTRTHTVPSIRSLEAFRLREGAAELEAAIAARRDAARDDLLFVQHVALSACANARRIEQMARPQAAGGEYPNYGLARRLREIADLIAADFGPRIYYTSLDGFDTHARQALAHGPLLRELGDSVAAFLGDLKSRGLAERVVLMTFSEFGRRLKENAGQGTDHGAAAPMFVAGAACRAGVLGDAPDLSNLEDGDVRHRVDFRQVYAELLDRWLNVDSRDVLGEQFEPPRILGA